MQNDSTYNPQVSTLKDADFPIIEIELNDIYDLGTETNKILMYIKKINSVIYQVNPGNHQLRM